MNTKAITPRGDTSWTPCRLRRGLFAAVFGLCGLATPALAQPGRSAVLLPPQAAAEHEVRTIARGAIDDSIDTLATTPVPRKTTAKPPSGPTWLNQDSAVRPVSGTNSFTYPATTVPAPTYVSDMPDVAPRKPSMLSRGMQKLRNVFSSGEPIPVVPPGMTSLPPSSIPMTTAPVAMTPTPTPVWGTAPREVAMPPRREMTASQVEPTREVKMPRAMPREVVAPREAPSPTSPLQGVSPSGAPVLAGPPAYRWYGYGTTTPGANPYSPSGQYPRASANWYTLTGATPGAFPVPVAARDAGQGAEPPTYRPAPITRISTYSPESVPQQVYTPPQPMIVHKPAAPAPVPFTPPAPVPFTPSITPAPVPSFTPPPPTMPSASMNALPSAVKMPALPPAPTVRPQTTALVPPLQTTPEVAVTAKPTTRPVSAVALPRIPELPTATVAAPPSPTSPAPLPILSVTPIAPLTPTPTAVANDELPWKSTPDRSEGIEGWMPADGMPRQQSRAAEPNEMDVQWQRQAAARAAIIARGQAPEETRQDPYAALIQSLLRGRAEGIDIRWNGQRKLMVCFEVSSNRDGSTLVRELSARPELAPLQIDFCVLVK